MKRESTQAGSVTRFEEGLLKFLKELEDSQRLNRGPKNTTQAGEKEMDD